MWRLHRPFSSLWTVLVSVLIVGVLLGVLGNCAYDELSTSKGCTLGLNLRDFLRPSILGVIVALLLFLGLRWAAGRSYRRNEALKSFALLKPVEKLSPEDFRFQVLRPSLKLSEKGWRSVQRSLTDRPNALFVLRKPAKSTVGALLEPLFGQFLYALR